MNEWVTLMDRAAALGAINYKRVMMDDDHELPTKVAVAVVDDGCDTEHPRLAGSIADVKSFESQQRVLNPASSHGTGSCGLVAGEAEPSANFPGGMAHGFASLIAVRYNSEVNVRNATKDIDMYKAVAKMGPRIITSSFGAEGVKSGERARLRIALAEISAEKNTVFLFAAGNAHKDLELNDLTIPDDAILVSATVSLDGVTETKVAASNYGACITVCAPSGGAEGGKAVSTATRSKGSSDVHASKNWDFHTDTSGACPLVAGVVALMLQANPNLTAREVKTILATTADKIDPNCTAEKGVWGSVTTFFKGAELMKLDPSLRARDYSKWYGFGRVNAARAVAAAYTAAGVNLPIGITFSDW